MKKVLPLCIGITLIFTQGARCDIDNGVLVLIKQLRDKDELTRMRAAKELGKLGAGAKDAIPFLSDLAKNDPDSDVRSVSKQAIEKIEGTLQSITRNDALRTLERSTRDVKDGDEKTKAQAVGSLLELLKSPDDVIRVKAAQALGDAGEAGAAAVSALKDASKDKDEILSRTARKSLEKITKGVAAARGREASEKLKPLINDLKSRRQDARLKALNEISKLGEEGKAAGEEVVEALLDPSATISQAAADCLEKIDPRLQKLVVTLLIDQNVQQRGQALQEIDRMGTDAQAALPVLLAGYQASGIVSTAVVRGRATSRRAVYSLDALLHAMCSVAPEDTRVIQAVLDTIKHQPTVASGLRFSAIDLGLRLKIDAKKMVPALIISLNDPYCRVKAIDKLAGFGDEASEAIPLLTKLKLDPVKEVREAAKEALAKIEK
jgi:HEAT repeat protein